MKKIPIRTIRRIGSERLGTVTWAGELHCGCAYISNAPLEQPPTEHECKTHQNGIPLTDGKPRKGK